MAQTPAALPKPTLPPFWKWLMRVTFAVTMVLFLAPTVYVIKYYAVDKPAEEAYARQMNVCECVPQKSVVAVVYWEGEAKDTQFDNRRAAIQTLGKMLRTPGVNVWCPLECLSAKATLADLATEDKNPLVRAAASEELGRVAQAGAVIRR